MAQGGMGPHPLKLSRHVRGKEQTSSLYQLLGQDQSVCGDPADSSLAFSSVQARLVLLDTPSGPPGVPLDPHSKRCCFEQGFDGNE